MKVYLKRYLGSSLQYQYEAKNIKTFSQGLTIPVQTFGLPESAAVEAILTKAEGNTSKITFAWIIKDETTSPALDSGGTAINAFSRNSDSTSWDPRTPEGAYVFLIEIFEKIGISTNEKYEFQLYDDDNSKSLLSRFGIISSINIAKGAQDPAVYNASIEFTVGEDVTVT